MISIQVGYIGIGIFYFMGGSNHRTIPFQVREEALTIVVQLQKHRSILGKTEIEMLH